MRRLPNKKPTEAAPAVELDPEETEEFYEALFDPSTYVQLRAEFPLSAHRLLIETCVKLGEYAEFDYLVDSLVLRMKYRHFFDPPLVEIDVLVTVETEPDIPGGYVRLTKDLNYLSMRNRRVLWF